MTDMDTGVQLYYLDTGVQVNGQEEEEVQVQVNKPREEVQVQVNKPREEVQAEEVNEVNEMEVLKDASMNHFLYLINIFNAK